MCRQIVLLWLATLFQSVASADDLYSSAASGSSRAWKIVGGGYLAQRDVNLNYQKKLDARNRVVEIGDPSSESGFRALPILTVEYSLSATDAVSFEYASTTVSTVAIAHRTQNLLFIPVRLASMIPVSIRTENIRFRYMRQLMRSGDWEVGGVLGIGKFTLRSIYPNGAGGIQADTFNSPFPELGISAKYRWGDEVHLNMRVGYFPIYSQQNRGNVADLDVGLEYAVNTRWLMGLGYRYSQLDIRLDKNTYRAEASYVVRGPVVYTGVRF